MRCSMTLTAPSSSGLEHLTSVAQTSNSSGMMLWTRPHEVHETLPGDPAAVMPGCATSIPDSSLMSAALHEHERAVPLRQPRSSC